MTEVRTTTLDGGLRVATDPMDTVETASVGVWVDIGTRHEAPEVNGVSHLLEHMAFKGTKRRSAQQIAEEVEAVGGHLNAYTSRENTAYYAKILAEDLPLALDVLADILQHSTMDEDELARERAVIIQEINQSHDTPDDIIFDHFQQTAYPEQGLGRPVLGLADLVAEMPRPAIMDYMHRHYSAPRMVLSASGKLDHDTILGMAQESFADLPPVNDRFGEPAAYRGGDFREGRDLEQVHLLLGHEGIPYEDDDFYAASVLSTLFGGGMSSRLFQEVREKRGLVYSIYSYVAAYSDGGLFGIYAGTGEKEVEELIPIVCDEIGKVCARVDADEVARARAQLKASILMARESTSSRCEQLARQLMVFGRPLTTEEIIEKIEAIDETAVTKCANRLFASTPTLAAMGPVGKVEEYGRVAERLGA